MANAKNHADILAQVLDRLSGSAINEAFNIKNLDHERITILAENMDFELLSHNKHRIKAAISNIGREIGVVQGGRRYEANAEHLKKELNFYKEVLDTHNLRTSFSAKVGAEDVKMFFEKVVKLCDDKSNLLLAQRKNGVLRRRTPMMEEQSQLIENLHRTAKDALETIITKVRSAENRTSVRAGGKLVKAPEREQSQLRIDTMKR
jgi:hypothetical protein